LNPNCDYWVGYQEWYMNASSGSCTQGGLSENFTFYIHSNMSCMLSEPYSLATPRGENDIVLRGNVTDNDPICGYVEDAHVEFLSEGASTYLCPSTKNESNGYYNCTILAANQNSLQYKWYNVTINASRPYYDNNCSYTYNESFFLASYPSLATPSVSPITEGWGSNYTYSIRVTDTDENYVDTYLWLSTLSDGPWNYEGTDNCTDCQNELLTFRKSDFTCNEINSSWYYYFNSSDQFGFIGNSTVESFTIQQDDVFVEYLGYDPIAPDTLDREGPNNLTTYTRVRDTDITNLKWGNGSNAYVGAGVNGSLWVTISGGSNWDTGREVITNASGYFEGKFDPNCTYGVGTHYWKTGTINDTCYKNSNQSVNYPVDLKGQLKANLTNPSYNETVPVGQVTKMYLLTVF